MLSSSVLSDSLRPHGLKPSRLLCPRNYPGKNTGVDCHFLLQGVFPAPGRGPCISVSCFGGQILLPMHHLERAQQIHTKRGRGWGALLDGGEKMDPQIREKKSKMRWTLEKDLWGKYRACKMKYLGMSGLGKEKTKDISLQIHLLHNLLCIPSRKFQDLR